MKPTELQIKISAILSGCDVPIDAVRELERLVISYCNEQTKWIPLIEKIPTYDHFVLWKRFDGICFVEHLDADMSIQFFIDKTGVTHWREIDL